MTAVRSPCRPPAPRIRPWPGTSHTGRENRGGENDGKRNARQTDRPGIPAERKQRRNAVHGNDARLYGTTADSSSRSRRLALFFGKRFRHRRISLYIVGPTRRRVIGRGVNVPEGREQNALTQIRRRRRQRNRSIVRARDDGPRARAPQNSYIVIIATMIDI